jgi:MFS family permease
MLWLVLCRGLQGVGGGGLNSLVMAIIGDVVPARQRSKYQAVLGIVATVALIAGPLLGGLFTDDLSWRWIFYLNIPVGIAALVAVAAFLHLPVPSARTATRRRIDGTGAVLATAFTVAVMLVATWGGTTRPWGSPPILALIAVSVLALAAYLAAERRAAEPLTPLHLFRSPVFAISAAQFLMATMVLFVAMLYIPAFLQAVQHKSAFTAGLYVIPLLVGLVAATAVAGPLIAKTGRYKQYPVIGAVLTGASMWGLSLAGAGSPAWAILLPLAFAGAGVGLFVQVSLLAGGERRRVPGPRRRDRRAQLLQVRRRRVRCGPVRRDPRPRPVRGEPLRRLPGRLPLDRPAHGPGPHPRPRHAGETAVGGDDRGSRGQVRGPRVLELAVRESLLNIVPGVSPEEEQVTP